MRLRQSIRLRPFSKTKPLKSIHLPFVFVDYLPVNVGIGHNAYAAVYLPSRVRRLMGPWGSLAKVNCGNADVTVSRGAEA